MAEQQREIQVAPGVDVDAATPGIRRLGVVDLSNLVAFPSARSSVLLRGGRERQHVSVMRLDRPVVRQDVGSGSSADQSAPGPEEYHETPQIQIFPSESSIGDLV